MKKKVLSLALALVLSLSMGMTAFAEESPAKPPVDTVIDGERVELDIIDSTTGMYQNSNAAQKAALDALGLDLAGDKISVDAATKLINEKAGLSFTGISVADWFDASLPAGVTMPAGGMTIEFNLSYIAAGDTVVMLHLNSSGVWENISCKVEAGKLTGNFTSLSPIFVFVLEGAAAIPAGTTPPPTKTDTNLTKGSSAAPKTGDVYGVYAAWVLAFISAAGIAVYAKKQKSFR